MTKSFDEELILEMTRAEREELPFEGIRKLQRKFRDKGIEIGRDALFKLLRENHLLARVPKRFVVHTTNSKHPWRKYPNLIKEYKPRSVNRVWVSDITYIRIKNEFAYLSLITDLYSHKIVGYCLHPSLETQGCINALTMTISSAPWKDLKGLIHHSDRGVQYCCAEYVRLLKIAGIEVSMTENGSPYENATAERVNGILKMEWINHEEYETFEQAERRIKNIIKLYNTQRLHFSCGLLTPQQKHGDSSGVRISPNAFVGISR